MIMMFRSVVDMKKYIIILSIVTILAAILSACVAVHRSNRNHEAKNSQTINEFRTDEESRIIVTGVPSFTSETSEKSKNNSSKRSKKTNNNGKGDNDTNPQESTTINKTDDNDVPFDSPDEESTTGNNETTETETSADSPTDPDGWINRWY